MSLITLPNRPGGTDVRSIEQVMADFDAVISVVNGHIDFSNAEPGVFIQKFAVVQSTGTGGLSNTAAAIPANACQAVFTIPSPAVATISARAVVDKTGGLGNLWCALLDNGAGIYAANHANSAPATIQAGGSAGQAPILSMMFNTGDANAGMRVGGTSGGGDFGSFTTGPSMQGVPISVYLSAGTHTIALAYWADSLGGSQATYSVNNQMLSVKV